MTRGGRVPAVAAALILPVLAAAQDRVHVVRPGDTLPRLVFLYGADAASIRRVNGLNSSDLRPGQRLVIPSASAPVARPSVPVEERRAESAEGMRMRAETPPAEAPQPAMAPEAPARSRGEDFAAAIALPASANVRYNGRWTPPGETSAWMMDCSNTSRWLHRTVNGIELPRTASDQYEWLRARRKLWKARPDPRALKKKLRPGDLLFWENTYKPVRKPPITHVMVYLGTDARGRMLMAGSQTSSGPDIYPFNPEQKMGGYRFFIFFRKQGRFVAYGRP